MGAGVQGFGSQPSRCGLVGKIDTPRWGMTSFCSFVQNSWIALTEACAYSGTGGFVITSKRTMASARLQEVRSGRGEGHKTSSSYGGFRPPEHENSYCNLSQWKNLNLFGLPFWVSTMKFNFFKPWLLGKRVVGTMDNYSDVPCSRRSLSL